MSLNYLGAIIMHPQHLVKFGLKEIDLVIALSYSSSVKD